VSSETAYLSNALAHEGCGKNDRVAKAISRETDQTVIVDPPTAFTTDEQLLIEVSQGSKAAFTQLFRRHQRAVFHVAWRILRDQSEAEDLRQEVFLIVLQKARLFDASKGDAASWIIQIAYHRAMNRRKYLSFRQHYSAEPLNEEQVGNNPSQLFVTTLLAKTMLEHFQKQLSPDQQQTLTLHFFEGYSLREVADMTKQTLGSVRHHYYRGLERLRAAVFPQKNTPE
jgi:RNA polymerase sigma-70 factor (ECF subfamily)